MTVLDQEQAVAVLTVVPPQGDTVTRVFVERPHQDLDPFHRAEQRRDVLLAEHPDATVTGNEAARHQHARRPCLFRFIGQKPCLCPKTYQLISSAYRG